MTVWKKRENFDDLVEMYKADLLSARMLLGISLAPMALALGKIGDINRLIEGDLPSSLWVAFVCLSVSSLIFALCWANYAWIVEECLKLRLKFSWFDYRAERILESAENRFAYPNLLAILLCGFGYLSMVKFLVDLLQKSSA